jgi:hypothetical protein
MRNLTMMTIAVALTVAACSPGEVSVARPFEEVQATEFVFEADPTDPMRGIFRVDTTEAMICAIVWGETEALGNFNNSLAMNGTGIIKHDVFLPGAEQGVEYFYRVQGTTADGTFYQSELMTFTIPVSDNTDTDESNVGRGINVAERAAIVEVSSEFSSAWSAANAVDGDLATEWSSAGDGDGSFITIDLGQVYDLIGVEFLTRSMADGSATTETFYVVGDDSERLGPFEAGNPAVPGFAPIDISTQTLRFEVESTTGGNTGAVEVRAFAESIDG